MKHKGTPSIKMDSTTFHSYRHLVWELISCYYMVKNK